MLTNFEGVDFQRPIKHAQKAQEELGTESLEAQIGRVARENADDEWEPDLTVGHELRRQYEGMNDEQRKGFDAALIALTGLSYERIVDNAITALRARSEQ